MLPPFNPYKLLFLYLKKNRWKILRIIFLGLLGVGFLGYGVFLKNRWSRRADLAREIEEPDLLPLFSLKKKYSGKFRVRLISWRTPEAEKLLSETGEFLSLIGEKLAKSQDLLDEGVIKELAEVNYSKKEGAKINLSMKDCRTGLVDLLATSRYKEILGKADNSFPLTLLFFFNAYTSSYRLEKKGKGECSRFPCCGLNPMPFELLSLSALALHISLVRYICLGEEKQIDYLYDLTKGSLIFHRRLQVQGVKFEREKILRRWRWWEIFLPGGEPENLLLPLSRGIFPEYDVKGEPCPYPYNISHQREIIPLYFLIARAFWASGKGRTAIASFEGKTVQVEVSKNLVLVRIFGNGMQTYTLLRKNPLACDIALSPLLLKVKAPVP